MTGDNLYQPVQSGGFASIRRLPRPLWLKFRTLAGGSAIAQLVSIAALPVLTRLYGPESFGVLGGFVASTTIAIAVAPLRFDTAITVSRSKRSQSALMVLGQISSVCIAALATILIGWTDLLMGVAAFFSVLAATFVLLVTGNCLRTGQLRRIAEANIIRATLTVAVPLILAFRPSEWNLVLGFVMGQMAAALWLIPAAPRLSQARRLLRTLRAYARFPLFGAPQNLCSSISQNAPVLVLTAMVNPEVAGAYWLTFRLLKAPAMLVGMSMRQSFMSHMATAGRWPAALLEDFDRMTALAAAVAFPVAITVGLFGETIFSLVLGNSFAASGTIATLLVWAWLIEFINPFSVAVLNTLKKQRLLFTYEVISSAARILALAGVTALTHWFYGIAALAATVAISNAWLIRRARSELCATIERRHGLEMGRVTL